jgi:hypothetical protein
VTYDQAPSNVTSTTPLPQGSFFIYDGVNCTTHALSKPVAGSGAGKVALLTGAYPTTCTYYDDVVRELQADGVVAVVFGLSGGSWRNVLLHGNPAGLNVPVLYMQVDEVSTSIRSAVIGGATVSASFAAVPGMSMFDDVDWFLNGETRTLALIPTLNSPSTGATWDLSSLDFDRTTTGIQQTYAFPSTTCGGTRFNYDSVSHQVTATVPATSTFTGSCTKTYLIRDTAGFQGIGQMSLYIEVPYARDDSAQTAPGVPVMIDVLANDAGASSVKVASRLDLDPTTTTIDSVVSSAQGTWSVLGNVVRFQPAPGFVGTASIQYVVRGANGGSSNAATISVSVGLSAAFDLNRQGLTGSWFQMATAGQGVELQVYPDLIAPGIGFLQGAWFTYDYKAAGGAASQRWYTFSGNVLSLQPSATLILYENTGGNFNAQPMTTATPVGTVVLSASDCTHVSMSYAFTDGSGRSGNIPMTRLLPNVTCTSDGQEPASSDFSYSGNWYDSTTSGQGVVFELNPNQPLAWITWYTFAPNGQGLGEAGQRWYTAQSAYAPGARSVSMTLYETTGGLFDNASPAPHTVPVGTVTATFTSCTAMQLAFAFTGGSSAGTATTINMTRVGPTPSGCRP